MDAEALGCFIDEHYHRPGDRLFRMEVLPEYEVGSDGEDFRRWLAGAGEPTWSRKQPWLDTLRREHANGQVSRLNYGGGLTIVVFILPSILVQNVATEPSNGMRDRFPDTSGYWRSLAPRLRRSTTDRR